MVAGAVGGFAAGFAGGAGGFCSATGTVVSFGAAEGAALTDLAAGALLARAVAGAGDAVGTGCNGAGADFLGGLAGASGAAAITRTTLGAVGKLRAPRSMLAGSGAAAAVDRAISMK